MESLDSVRESALEPFERLLEKVVPHASQLARTSTIHGPAHWRRVASAGLELCSKTPGADPHVVEMFAVFHDSRRLSDGHDPDHGSRGAALAEELRRRGLFKCSDGRMELLKRACQEHANGRTTDDSTIAACWDADRLDLGRVGIEPDPRLLSTAVGKEWARGGRGPTGPGEGASRSVAVEEDVWVTNPDGLDAAAALMLLTRIYELRCSVSITPHGGRGFSWEADAAHVFGGESRSERYNLVRYFWRMKELAGRLVELGIRCGNVVSAIAEGVGEDARAAVTEIRRALQLDARSDLELHRTLGTPIFLRFRAPPLSGHSKNYFRFNIHAGISVYRGRFLDDDLYELDGPLPAHWSRERKNLLSHQPPAYLCVGPELVSEPWSAPEIRPTEFWPVPRGVNLTLNDAAEVDDGIPFSMAYFVKCWNRGTRDEDLIAMAVLREWYKTGIAYSDLTLAELQRWIEEGW